jgi:hypothetical protein
MQMRPQRRPLHFVQFIAGLAMFPLAIWFYIRGDFLGVVFATIAGVLAVAYTCVNLFIRQWP